MTMLPRKITATMAAYFAGNKLEYKGTTIYKRVELLFYKNAKQLQEKALLRIHIRSHHTSDDNKLPL